GRRAPVVPATAAAAVAGGVVPERRPRADGAGGEGTRTAAIPRPVGPARAPAARAGRGRGGGRGRGRGAGGQGTRTARRTAAPAARCRPRAGAGWWRGSRRLRGRHGPPRDPWPAVPASSAPRRLAGLTARRAAGGAARD